MKQPVEVIRECAEELIRFEAQRKANDAFVGNELKVLAERLKSTADTLERDGQLNAASRWKAFGQIVSVLKVCDTIKDLIEPK